MNNLTDRAHWKTYWSNYQFREIPQKTPFDFILPCLKIKGKFIEIGGFPGTFSAYFHKKGFESVTLLDFYIDQSLVNGLEEKNKISQNTIRCIESDFFELTTDEQFNLVFSSGFVEHFENTQDVIRRHVNLISPNGQLLIVIPNFRGLNGLIQKCFDRKNFDVHNLESMKKSVLQKIVADLNLNNIRIEYARKPMVWLEPNAGSGLSRKLVKLVSYFLKLFPIKCRLLSPFIVVYGEKG